MKAVLVIDMPSRCFNCPLHQVVDGEEEHEFMVFCNAEHWREPITHQPVENLEERPKWCPLKPLNDKAVKIGNKDFMIYQREYLMEHLDREYELLKSAKEFEEKQNDIQEERETC